MILCLIEFGVREGQLEARNEQVAILMKAIVDIEGFISKETFTSKDHPDKLVTLSYWRDAESLDAWMRNMEHKRAVGLGFRSILSYYKIQILTVERNSEWTAPNQS